MQLKISFPINLIIVCAVFFSFKMVLGESPERTKKAKVDSLKRTKEALPHFQPVPDRWQGIKLPPYELNVAGHIYDPYNQNILKGDFPIIGQSIFFILVVWIINMTCYIQFIGR